MTKVFESKQPSGEKWIGIDREELIKIIQREMPHLEFAVWDLTPFMPGFHNWRKNMAFVECEGLVVEELAKKVSQEFDSVAIYTGTKKIRERDFNTGPTNSTIVILARRDFKDTKKDEQTNTRMPSIEERVVDLLAYSLRENIPIPLSEAENAIGYVLRTNQGSIAKMHRYSTRKYIDWFFKIIISEMAKRSEISGIDPRLTKAGEQYLRAIKGVENRE